MMSRVVDCGLAAHRGGNMNWRVVLIAMIFTVAGLTRATAQPPRLVGIVTASTGDVAYLEDAATGTVRGYRVGEVIGEAELILIEPDRAVLQQGQEQIELVLGATPPSNCAPDSQPMAVGSPSEPCPPNCPAPKAMPLLPPMPGVPCPPGCPAPPANDPCPPSCPTIEAQHPTLGPIRCPPFCGGSPSE